MYTTLPHLQSAVRAALQKGQICRIYQDTLNACWPGLPEDALAVRIEQFAVQNRWTVGFRNLGSLGFVAEFQKAGLPQAAA